MFRSKAWTGTLRTALVVAAVSLGGCWKPSQKDDPHNGKSERDATASFFINRIDRCEAVTPRVSNKLWKIADHKEIFVTACVTDRKAGKEVKGHKFTVEFPEEGSRRQVGMVTDDRGCFQWAEHLPYNPLAEKSGYLEVVRRVYGEGVHVGFRDVRLAINPWAGERGIDKQNACKYLKNDQVSASQKLDPSQTMVHLQGKNGATKLWMSDVFQRISMRDERDEMLREERNKFDKRKDVVGQTGRKGFIDESGALLEILLSMKPQVKVEGIDGNPEYIDLKSGQFNVWVQLIAANVGDKRDQTLLLTPNLVPADAKVIANKLEAAVRMGLSRRVTRGNLELAIKVVPVGLGVEVQPFEALYVLGEIEAILGGARPMLSPKVYESDKAFNYDQYVTAAENFEELKRSQQALQYEPFIFETASVMFAGVRPGETATTRTIEYKVQSCVRDTLTGRRVQHQKFQIFDEDGKEIFNKNLEGKKETPTTNQEGCLVWTSSLTHKYYKPEEFFFPEFKIVHPGSSKAKLKQLVVNPWDAMFRTFGFDRIEFPQDFIDSVRSRKKIPSRMFIPRYSYHAIRFRYEIDRFMELEVKKQILLNLRPDVLRYSGIIGGRKVTESLRDGLYLMKVAIQKDYLDPADKGNMLRAGRDARGNSTTLLERRHGTSTPKHFVTVVKKIVRVNGGEINTPVEFAVRDLRMMRIRSQFLVQIEPIDEQALLLAKVMSDQDRKKLDEEFKVRAMSDEMRRVMIADKREKREAALFRLRSKLNRIKDGMLDVDKLASMTEAELKEFDLTPELGKEVVEDLKTNDFTVMNTAPIVDLDKLVEKDSGLERRTFVGPMIFLSNAYSDDLRPTDNLDERSCEVSDCDELKILEVEGRRFRNNYDTSKYFGSIAHMGEGKGIQVDDLINEYKADRAEYKRVMPALASVVNFADLYNLKFVTLGNEKAMRTDFNCTAAAAEQCMVAAPDVQLDLQKLLHDMNAKEGALRNFNASSWQALSSAAATRSGARQEILRNVTVEDLRRLALGQQPSIALGDRLCKLHALGLGRVVKNEYASETMQASVYRGCLNALISGLEHSSPFSLDQKIRVYETGEYVYKGGKQMNLNVGSSFSLNHSTSFGYSIGAGFDLFDMPIVGKLFSSGWAKPFSLKVGVGGGANRQRADGTSISESTYLVMQAASFAIQLKDYERCTVVRANAQSMGWHEKLLLKFTSNDEERDNLLRALNQGWLICSGQRETKPLPVTESYYYFTQHFTEGDMLDQADLYNHPWLLAMRGVRDFSVFAYLIRAQEVSILFSPINSGQKIVDKPGWPLDQMVEAYRRVLPTFPGLYTVLKKGEALQEFPFDQDPEKSFK